MNYFGMPMGMWALFGASFQRNLTAVFELDRDAAKVVTSRAKRTYQELIRRLPEFEKGDRFQMNIVSCAMLAAFVLCMPERPDVERLTVYYRQAMMTPVMGWFCRVSGKKKFTPRDLDGMKKAAAFRAADRNPYSWNMDFLPYADGSGYEARFTRCGICALMGELGLSDLVPALCALDYAMNEAGGTSRFTREYTLASGGPYCDCRYQKKRVPTAAGRLFSGPGVSIH